VKTQFRNLFNWFGLVTLVATLALGIQVGAQAISGDVVGTILDKTGAIVPHASVEAVSTDKGTRYTAESNDAGEYRFTNLPVGTYKISATAPNFALTTINNFNVELNKSVTLHITLEVKGTATSIEVSGDAQTLDTTTSTLSNTFEQKQLADLPSTSLGASGILNLSLLSAGVANAGALGAGSGPSVGGQRPRNNNFTVEGIDNNSKSVTGPLVPVPNDSVAEFTVLQNQYSPEFGHSSGGQFNFVLKSGSNSFHGLGYIYSQNRNLNAMDQVTKNNGFTSNQRFDNNRFGGNIGGPVLKNKLFFFGSAQYNPVGQASIPGAPVCTPTASGYSTLAGIPGLSATNLGVFQQYATAAPSPSQSDPSSFCATATAVNDAGGNQIDSVINVAGQNVQVATLPVAAPNYNNTLTWLTKIDYDISSRDQLRGAFIKSDFLAIDNAPTLPAFYLLNPANNNRLLTLNEYHTFGPTLSNEVRFGFNRTYLLTSTGKFSFPGLENADGSPNFPNLTFDDLNFLQLGPDPNGPQYTYQNVYQLGDNLTWTKGHHTFKFGVEGRKYISPQSFTQRSRGDYEYGTVDRFFRDVNPDVLAERSLGNPVYYGDQSAIYWYANDEWRLRPNFTVNLGVRYEYTTIPFGERAQALNEAASVPGLINFSEPRAAKNNWGPRVSLAYSPGSSGRTSIRAGFAVAYDVLYDNIGILSLPPQLSGTVDTPFTPDLPNYLANGGIPPTAGGIVTFPDVASQRDATANYIVVNQLDPKSITWTLGVQHQFLRDYTLEVRYVGTRGMHLNTQERLNRQPLTTNSVFLPTYTTAPDQATLDALPFTQDGIANGAYGNGDSFVPAFENAGFAGTNLVSFQPNGDSTYHGLATQVTRRMSHGLQFIGSYTWSHTIDNSTADFFSTVLNPRRTQDFQNLANDRSNSAIDRRHRVTIAAIYDLPFFKSGNWMKKNVLGNWEVGPIYTFQSPQWMTVQSGSDANGNGDTAGDRAVFNPGGTPGVGSGVTPLCTSSLPGFATCGENDFDSTVGPPGPGNFNSTPFIVAYAANNSTAQYIQAGKFAQLNAGRNTLPSRHINDLDLTALKRFSFGERYTVEFSMQALNVLNHPQFVPGSLNDVSSISFTGSRAFLNPGSPAFGDIESVFPSNARSLQLGLKFKF
jgi:hypothetical protein